MDSGKISVIIPVYNESAAIGALMARLSPLMGDCEIIFVDGGSTDNTVEQVALQGGFALTSPQKGRANQMNFGALRAGGDILWFLHADSLPPPNALTQIRAVLGSGYGIGCFPIQFDSKHPLMRVNAFLSNNLRARLFSIAFGDQGIFIKKDLFDGLGGYPSIPLMEDYKLSLEARKAGYRIGLAKGKITTSERRYLQYGRLKTILKMWSLQRRFRRGDDIEKIARIYQAGDKTEDGKDW